MDTRRSFRRFAAVMLIALMWAGLPPAAHGQATRGTILGTITDQTGAALPGVTVVATETRTNVSHNTVTNETGNFTFPNISDGIYNIKAEIQGFKTVDRTVKHKEEVLQVLEDGEFVGEMALINELPRSADAVALTDCNLIRMDNKSFEKTVASNNKLAVSFIKFLSHRLRDTNDIVMDMTDRNLTNNFYIDIMREFIKRGKKDREGKWMLLDQAEFLDTFKQSHEGGEEIFWKLLDKVLAGGDIVVKKDAKGNAWMAFKIEQ